MADNNSIKPFEVFYYIMLTAAVTGFGFFGYLKVSNTCIFLFGRIFDCYTLLFTAVLAVLLIRISAILKKTKGKLNYQAWLTAAGTLISLVCFINCAAENVSDSAVNRTVKINDQKRIMLCEVTETEKDGSEKSVRIDVYRIGKRFANKVGEIDETLFANKCVESGSFNYYISEDDSFLTIECFYGSYGSDVFKLDPAADTGSLQYNFLI